MNAISNLFSCMDQALDSKETGNNSWRDSAVGLPRPAPPTDDPYWPLGRVIKPFLVHKGPGSASELVEWNLSPLKTAEE